MAPRTRNNVPDDDHAPAQIQDAPVAFDIPDELKESPAFISFMQGVLQRTSPFTPYEGFSVSERAADMSRFVRRLSSKVESMDGRLASLEGRMESFENKMDSLDAKVVSLDSKVGSLESKLDDAIEKLSIRLEQAFGYGQENVDPQFVANGTVSAYPFVQRQVRPPNQAFAQSGNQYMMYPPQHPSTTPSYGQNSTSYPPIAPRRF